MAENVLHESLRVKLKHLKIGNNTRQVSRLGVNKIKEMIKTAGWVPHKGILYVMPTEEHAQRCEEAFKKYDFSKVVGKVSNSCKCLEFIMFVPCENWLNMFHWTDFGKRWWGHCSTEFWVLCGSRCCQFHWKHLWLDCFWRHPQNNCKLYTQNFTRKEKIKKICLPTIVNGYVLVTGMQWNGTGRFGAFPAWGLHCGGFSLWHVPGAFVEGFLGTECDRAQHCGPLRLRLDYGYSPTASGDVSTPQLVWQDK